MKRFFILLNFNVVFICLSFSQTTLSFTGQLANNSYLRLDSVVVENLSRSWSETLVYPDTAITFSNLSIADVRGGNISIESYPNPFRCTAQVHISHAEAGDYSLRLYSLSGQVLSEKTVRLDGDNIFEVSLKKARTAVLTIRSEQVSKSVKLIGRGGASADAIKFISTIRGGEKRQSARPFVSGDTMRYIGYATVDGCAVGSKKTVKAQNSDETFRMVFMEGAVLGAFSVSPTQKVFFSKGNLQWSATGGRSTPTTHLVVGDTTAAGTWRFAEQQTYFVGNNNRYISSTYTGWIDLFGWGTSGYNNAHPYISSFTRSDYPQGAAYIARTNYDWGVYNAISNGENTPGRWRTLTLSEASYIFQGRTDAALKRGEAIIDGIKGLVLLPDSWTLSTDQPFIADTGWQNIYTAQQWEAMEDAGAVFLPAAGGGDRSGGGPTYHADIPPVGISGIYWLATWNTYSGGGFSPGPYIINFFSSGIYHNSYSENNYWGHSVRLVRDAK